MRCNSYGFNAEGLFTGQETWSEECRWVKNNLFDSANEDCTANVSSSDSRRNIRRCSMNCGNYSNMASHDFSLTDSDVYRSFGTTGNRHQKRCNRCSVFGWHNISTNIHSVTFSESCESFWIPNPSFDKNDCTAPFVLSTPNKCYYKCSKNCGNYGKRSEHSFLANVYRRWDNTSHKRGCLYCNQFGTGNNSSDVEGCSWTKNNNFDGNDCCATVDLTNTDKNWFVCSKNCGNYNKQSQHDFSSNSTEYKFTGKDTHNRQCSRCNQFGWFIGNTHIVGRSTDCTFETRNDTFVAATGDCTVDYYKCNNNCGNVKGADNHYFMMAYQQTSINNIPRHNRKCSRCSKYGITEGSTHSLNGWNNCIYTNGDCVNGACKDCGKNEHHYLNHDFSVYLSTTATCTSAGYNTNRCSRCSITKNDIPRDALPHPFGGWSPATNTVCSTRMITQTRTCTVCGTAESQTIQATGGHFYTVYESTTALQSGPSHRLVCRDCGYPQTSSWTGCTLQWRNLGSTCQQYCPTCGYATTAQAHSYDRNNRCSCGATRNP